MQHAFRLTRGQDLKQSLLAFARENAIDAAVPVSCVGCLLQWRMRCADGQTIAQGSDRVEIVSLTGTLSRHGCHLHIALAREDLSVIGGHLVDGCIVNTTAEVVLLEMQDMVFRRAYDETTGYDELDIQEKK